MAILFYLFMFVVGFCLMYFWNKSRFNGLFYRRCFEPGMLVEIWHREYNIYGIEVSYLVETYQVVSVDFRRRSITLRRDSDWVNPVSFAWLFERAYDTNGYIILKDSEERFIKKLR